jgi:hypothetical protein
MPFRFEALMKQNYRLVIPLNKQEIANWLGQYGIDLNYIDLRTYL